MYEARRRPWPLGFTRPGAFERVGFGASGIFGPLSFAASPVGEVNGRRQALGHALDKLLPAHLLGDPRVVEVRVEDDLAVRTTGRETFSLTAVKLL